MVVANRTLTNETISNYGVMDHRTITTDIHVVYETSAKKLELIPTLIQELFTDREHTELKRVHLTSLGDSSIVYTYRYTIFSQDYELYLNVQQNVYLDLIKLFRKHKIEFAYPTQKLFFS